MKLSFSALIFTFLLTFSSYLFLAAGPNSAWAQSRDIQECRKDSDCIFVGTECVSGAVNKRYKGEAERFMKNINRDMDTCNGKKRIDEKSRIAFCYYPEVECKNSRYSSKKDGKCYSQKGTCSLKY